MDANKFATMLHRSSTKIKHALVFAGLEWALIILLLLNALFQYMIVKFASYFGLKPPCFWCSRVDHLIEPRRCSNLHRDHLCEAHSEEVSKLGYCSAHQKLADCQSMCEDCSSSRQDFCGFSLKFNFVQWVKATGVILNDDDMVIKNGVEGLCSCCGVIFERQIYAPYVPIKPSNWNHFKYDIQEKNLITEKSENQYYGKNDEKSDFYGIDFVIAHFNGDDHGFKGKLEKLMLSSVDGVLEGDIELNEEVFGITMNDPSSDEIVHQQSREKDASFEILQQHLEFLIDGTGQQLVPVESIGSTTADNDTKYGVEDHEKNSDCLEAPLVYEDVFAAPVVSDQENTEETEFAENYLLVPPQDGDLVHEQIIQINVQDTAPYFLAVSEEGSEMQLYQAEKEAPTCTEVALADMEGGDQDVPIATEDLSTFMMSDTDTEVSIGAEIPDLNSTEDAYTEDNHCLHAETSASCTSFHAHYEHGSETDSQETVDLSTFMIELNDHNINSQSSVYFEINGNEDENFCERPNSSNGHSHVDKTSLFHQRKDSEADESLEGSVINEFDDEVMTVESLNSTLRAERKALNVVYAELEEERNASAVAASQTMAMINRLQEEKAAMQMEASHYQRMMEEKSEYDQEAMQLMNDLMVKMDSERQWLEKELEVCREKLLDYEAKENMVMLQRSMDESAKIGFSSVSCCTEEDSDEISIDLNKEENKSYGHQGNGCLNTPVKDVLYFRDQFGSIDEERMSLIDQLKALEDKHCASSEDEQHFEKHLNLERSSGIVGEYENAEFSIHYNEFDAAITRFKLQDRRAAMKNEE
ncbi:probable myosin-binding protein 4 isoform X2 [Daucus carota subsp. sativus]|uniref:probable myosin-binding protein 4 isoform X2 n=1 Tax=Daucus carota subsp. sativus TaxID=79200 RepID=UPI003082FAD0